MTEVALPSIPTPSSLSQSPVWLWVVAICGITTTLLGVLEKPVRWAWHFVTGREAEAARREERDDKRAADYIANLKEDAARLRAENKELTRDRNRGWDLARWWNDKAHQLRHERNNARQIVELGHLPHGDWTDPGPLPGLEEPET